MLDDKKLDTSPLKNCDKFQSNDSRKSLNSNKHSEKGLINDCH